MSTTVILTDGRRLQKYIEHAIGSLQRPMTDIELEVKLIGLTDGVLPSDQVQHLVDLCWQVEKLPAVGELAKAGTSFRA